MISAIFLLFIYLTFGSYLPKCLVLEFGFSLILINSVEMRIMQLVELIEIAFLEKKKKTNKKYLCSL